MAKQNEYEFGAAQTTEKQPGGFGGRGGRSMGGGEKAKNFKASLSKLVVYCKKYLPAIVVAIAFAAIAAVLAVIGPNQISKVTDLISEGLKLGAVDLTAIGSVCIMLVFL